jgi:hypothetical protein
MRTRLGRRTSEHTLDLVTIVTGPSLTISTGHPSPKLHVSAGTPRGRQGTYPPDGSLTINDGAPRQDQRAYTRLTSSVERRRREPQRRRELILATTKVEDFDRFLKVFSTKGAEKRKQHGSNGSTVFRDPNEDDRVWVLFDWDGQGWQNFVSDPEVPAILQEAGHKGKPQAAELGGQYDA